MNSCFTLGDLAYDSGTHAEFADCFDPTWGAFKDRLRPVPGNHEYRTPGAAGYFDYFGAQAGPDRRGYYSFDYGGWHFIALNSEVDVSVQSPQYLWLKADLAQVQPEPVHDRLLASPRVHLGRARTAARWRCGHSSTRCTPPGWKWCYPETSTSTSGLHRSGPTERPIPHAGCDSSSSAPAARTCTRSERPYRTAHFRYNANWGVLRLRLGQGRYGWQFVPVDGGAPIDAGSATCHR